MGDEMSLRDYVAASEFPHKLLYQEVVRDGKILPIHVQYIPTNKCNLNCGICSYSDRDKNLEISLEQSKKIFETLSYLGTKAMTITGGGEPLKHPHINEMIDSLEKKDIKVGLVTNGLLLRILDSHKNLTWCRISSSDDRIPAYNSIKHALSINPDTDWAFSHVVTKNPNYEIIEGVIDFANEYNFTHVRLVSDLLDLDNVDMEQAKINIKLSGIDDGKVIYQERKDSTQGTEKCYISLLKPVISPEGVFPCCGTNYAIKGSKRKPIKKMKMGKVENLASILDSQKHFNGSVCDTCYYSQYNKFLGELLDKPQHMEFA